MTCNTGRLVSLWCPDGVNRTFEHRSNIGVVGANPWRKVVIEEPRVANGDDDYAQLSTDQIEPVP